MYLVEEFLGMVGFELVLEDVFEFECEMRMVGWVVIDRLGGEVGDIVLRFGFRRNELLDVDSVIMEVDLGKVVDVVRELGL